MIKLSEYEKDAISEAFNIGMGQAGSALSEMIGKEVVLSIPNIAIEKKSEAAASLVTDDNEDISGVRESYSGPFQGSALLLFPESRSLELVRLILQQPDVDIDYLTEMEQEALVEIGNIILNSCLASIAEIMNEEIINEIPEPVKGRLHDVILGGKETSEDDYIMKLRMEFSVQDVDIHGHIAFIMDIHSLDNFRHTLAEYFGFSVA